MLRSVFFSKTGVTYRNNPLENNFRIYHANDLNISSIWEAEAIFAEFEKIAKKDRLIFEALEQRRKEVEKQIDDSIKKLRSNMLAKLQKVIDDNDLMKAYMQTYENWFQKVSEVEFE